MIGNLNLRFKKAKLKDNRSNVREFTENNINLVIGISHESDLSLHLGSHIYDLVRASNHVEVSDEDAILDLEYYFDEIVEDEDIDDLSLDYDFREMYP